MLVNRRCVVPGIGLAIAVMLAACTSASGPQGPATVGAPNSAPAPTATTTLAVTRVTETFVDGSRRTDDPEHARSAATRTFETDIYIPAGNGPYPLILHAHGSGGDPRKFTEIAKAWAQHGYVVAVPTFPLTSDTSGGSSVIGDYVSQPADLHFVLDQVLSLTTAPNTALTGKVDQQHIGLSGLSLGGATAYGLAFNTCCRDPRVTAVVIMSGIRLAFGNHGDVFDKPILIFHGTDDPVIAYSTAGPAYASAAAPKYFVTLIGAGHAPPYEDTPDPHDGIVTTVTLDFWDAYLKAQDTSRTDLLADANQPPLSTLQSAPQNAG